MTPLKLDMSQPSKMFKEKLSINCDGIRIQDIKFFIILDSWTLIPAIELPISQLPDIVQKCFCTPDGAMDPTFLMKYVTAF